MCSTTSGATPDMRTPSCSRARASESRPGDIISSSLCDVTRARPLNHRPSTISRFPAIARTSLAVHADPITLPISGFASVILCWASSESPSMFSIRRLYCSSTLRTPLGLFTEAAILLRMSGRLARAWRTDRIVKPALLSAVSASSRAASLSALALPSTSKSGSPPTTAPSTRPRSTISAVEACMMLPAAKVARDAVSAASQAVQAWKANLPAAASPGRQSKMQPPKNNGRSPNTCIGMGRKTFSPPRPVQLRGVGQPDPSRSLRQVPTKLAPTRKERHCGR